MRYYLCGLIILCAWFEACTCDPVMPLVALRSEEFFPDSGQIFLVTDPLVTDPTALLEYVIDERDVLALPFTFNQAADINSVFQATGGLDTSGTAAIYYLLDQTLFTAKMLPEWSTDSTELTLRYPPDSSRVFSAFAGSKGDTLSLILRGNSIGSGVVHSAAGDTLDGNYDDVPGGDYRVNYRVRYLPTTITRPAQAPLAAPLDTSSNSFAYLSAGPPFVSLEVEFLRPIDTADFRIRAAGGFLRNLAVDFSNDGGMSFLSVDTFFLRKRWLNDRTLLRLEYSNTIMAQCSGNCRLRLTIFGAFDFNNQGTATRDKNDVPIDANRDGEPGGIFTTYFEF